MAAIPGHAPAPNHAPAPAPTYAEHLGAKYWIEVGLDYGTSTIKGFFTVLCDDKQLFSPSNLLLQSQPMISSAVAWHDHEFHWGADLTSKVDQGRIPADKVIQFAKLALYEGFTKPGTSRIVDRVTEQLKAEGFTLDQMLATHFEHIVPAIRQSISRCACAVPFSRFGDSFLMDMPIRARCTLPHTFGPKASTRLQTAVKAAGVSVVALASEQVCALAAYIDLPEHLNQSLPMSEGTNFILMDGGCGTVDSVLFRCLGGERNSARFEMIGESTGSVSGSQRVNELIKTTLEETIGGGVPALLESLDITRNDLDLQLHRSIEDAKRRFAPHSDPADDYRLGPVVIQGGKGTEVHFVTRNMVRDALDVVIAENRLNIDHLVQIAKPKFIVLAGGFGQCDYMRVKFENWYGKDGIRVVSVANRENGNPLLVAQGAVSSRYSKIETQKLPFRYGYACLQDMPYDPDIHQDCWVAHYDKHGQRKRVSDPRKVARRGKMASTRDFTVIDRLRFIRPQGSPTQKRISLHQKFRPLVADPRISLNLVYTEGAEHLDYGPALVDDHDVYNNTNMFRKGVHSWTGVEWRIPNSILTQGNWRQHRLDDGNLCYADVDGIVTIRCLNEKDVKVEIALVLPNLRGEVFTHRQTARLQGNFTIFDGTQSEFVPDIDASGSAMEMDTRDG